MSREQGSKMLCWNGEGGRKPPHITESGLAVQRASPATLPAGDAGAQPPSAQLLTHLPWLSSTENVDRFQRPVHTLHTSPLALALTDVCADISFEFAGEWLAGSAVAAVGVWSHADHPGGWPCPLLGVRSRDEGGVREAGRNGYRRLRKGGCGFHKSQSESQTLPGGRPTCQLE